MAGPAPVGMVHDVPDADVSTSQPPHRPHRQVDAVLFDFQGTLAQVEDPVDWVIAAAAACGAELDRAKATALADRLVTAGRAGGPPPHRVPPHLAEVWADRDLYEHCHRAAYTGLAATVGTDVEGLAEALYDRLLGPEGWLPYADTEPTLRTLHDAGIKVGVVSNMRACGMVGSEPERTLMVGDTPADAGAVKAGCAALVLPAAEPGRTNGLGATLALAGCP